MIPGSRGPKLSWLETQPGMGLVWPTPPEPPSSPTTPEDWRRAVLARAWAERGGRDLAADQPSLRDLTLLDWEALSAGEFAAVIAEIRALGGETMVRLSAPLRAGNAWIETLTAIAEDCDDPPFVQAIVHSGFGPEDRALDGLGALASRGWPLAAEIWLLRDGTAPSGLAAVEPLRALLRELLRLRVRPYYLVDGAWLPREMRVPEPECLELVRGLRGWISGLAVPQLVHEDCDGRRHPRIPSYIESADEHRVTLRNYAGNLHVYSNPPARTKD